MNHDIPPFGGQFGTTHWSVVLQAGSEAAPESVAALEKLCRAYWQPIYAFARRRGRTDEDAKDLTQEFFARLLERRDFSRVEPSKGRFRTFLLTAFTHFLANEYDHATALKRGGGQAPISLDQLPAKEQDSISPAEGVSPGEIYDLRWAQTILRTALRRLKEEMAEAEKQRQFGELERFLTLEADPGEYASAAQRLGVAAASVPVLVHRLRQRYRALVRTEVAETVSSPTELEEELRHLFAVLNR